MHKSAIIYHYLALYRLPIFQQLMNSKEIEFTIYSGIDSEIDIKKIDVSLSILPTDSGGLRWKLLKNKWLFKNKFLWQSGLIKVVLSEDYDSFIFLGSPYHISTWIAAMIARLRRKKVFYWMHGVYKDKITLIDYLKLFVFYKIANGFFLYGKRSFEILNKYKIKPIENINIIYNSLDYKKSFEFRKEIEQIEIFDYRVKYFNDKTTPIIVFIGRLNYTKRLDMLIEAQDNLRNKYKKNFFNILIIGDGEEMLNLVELSKKKKLEKNISFLGAIYDEEINSHALMYADLCVTPGEVGLTAIHSLSYGTPVISHDNLNLQMPEVESIIKGVNGNLYKYNSIESLSQVIDSWLSENPIKTQSIAEDCYAIIDKFYNPNNQLKIFESVLLNNKIS